MSGHTPWEPSEEALGAALTAIDHARLPWLARWVLRDGSKARSILGRETARRVEGRVAARVREETTARINESWARALEEQAAAQMPRPEPVRHSAPTPDDAPEHPGPRETCQDPACLQAVTQDAEVSR